MKDFHKTVLVVFLVVAVVFMISSKHTSDTPRRFITVSGDADVMVEPDEVIISVGISTFNKDLDDAKDDNEKKTKKVLKSIFKNGIDKKFVQTNYIRINPEYSSWTHRTIQGYYVYENIMVTLRDIDKFEDIITDVLDSGANHIYGINFRTTKLRKYKDQARELALIAAKEKATDMSSALDEAIGKPSNINESQTYWYCWYNGWWRGGSSFSMAQNVVQNIQSGSSYKDDSIAPGRIRVNAKVSVTFELI